MTTASTVPAPRRLTWLPWLAAIAVLWLALLGHRDLVEPDEGRYAEISREMLASGDWVTPRLNGFKYFEKPPLHYWANAVSLRLFGASNAAARLWTALLGLAGILWAGLVATRLYGREAGARAALYLSGALLWVTLGHFNALDMGLAVFIGLGLGALLLAQSGREASARTRHWMLLAWASLAAATLTKGLVGLVLPGAAVALYSLWQRDWALWRHLHLGRGLALFLLLTAPWIINVSLANPEFPRFFFVHEHWERYTTTTHDRSAPWWYFAPILALAVLPWLATSLRALAPARPGWRLGDGRFAPERLLWVYTLFTFAFFSLSGSKLPSYILPILPALALLAAAREARPGLVRGDAVAAGLLGLALAGVAWRIRDLGHEGVPAELLAGYRPWVLVSAALLLTGALLAYRHAGAPVRATALLAVAALGAFQVLGWGFQALSPARSSRALAEAVRPYLRDGVPIYDVGRYQQALPFYLGRTTTLVRYRGELRMGIDLEPERWIGDYSTFLRRWRAEDQAVAVLRRKNLPDWQRRDMPMRIIYRDPSRVAVLRR